jgi:hypothetical protein
VHEIEELFMTCQYGSGNPLSRSAITCPSGTFPLLYGPVHSTASDSWSVDLSASTSIHLVIFWIDTVSSP